MTKIKIAVLGVQNSCGREILALLEENSYKAEDIFALEPKAPLGTLVSFGEDDLIREGTPEGFEGNAENRIKPDIAQETLRLSVSKSSLPHFTQSIIEVKRGNSTMKFAGTPTFSDGSLKCNDYVGARTKDVLLAWQRMAYDVVNDVVELAGNYKRNCKLVEYTPDYSRIVRSWNLIGCWVKTLSEGNFSHDSNDKRSIDVTIVFDRAIPELEKPVAAEEVNK